jgi:hypothetical protein
MADLIPVPVLDGRDEEQLAAEMIGRVSGERDSARVETQINVLQNLQALLAADGLPAPACPELTNANPSSPHTVVLETFGWALGQQARKIDQVPEQNLITFMNLFGTGLRAATKATTTLRFTADGQHDATVPAGTVVSTADGLVSFATSEDLVIPADPDNLTGDVAAESSLAGAMLLAPDTLTRTDVLAFIVSVTNPAAVDSGTDTETLDAAKQRARNFQRRGTRLVSAQDVEDWIFDEVMKGAGIVKVFPFVKQGDFDVRHAGHTSIVVMTASGNVVSDEIKAAITAGLAQQIGSIFFYLLDPEFVQFDVEATIKVQSIAPQNSIVAAVERNLRAFYAAKKGNFGRTILRAEIIAIIEGTPGVDRIASEVAGPIVQTPDEDLDVLVYQLPKLSNVTITIAP